MVFKLTGQARLKYSGIVWDMYEKTYSDLGMQFNNVNELFKETSILEMEIESGEPFAFSVYKKTNFGNKIVAIASNRTIKAKRNVIKLIGLIDRPGYYGELCGAPQRVALKMNLRIIHTDEVKKILNKPIEVCDSISYLRNVNGIGISKKIMFGQPVIGGLLSNINEAK